jgi:hypothetical protein
MDAIQSTNRKHPNTAGKICFLAATSFFLAPLLAFVLVLVYLVIDCLMHIWQWYLALP